ncbi:catalase [Clostridium psychrophilum]|nr:catalase [Clostridium psychrophilum]
MFTDIGTIKSYTHIEGFSANTYKWINAGNAKPREYKLLS